MPSDVEMEVETERSGKKEGKDKDRFYLRYYVGHRGKFGHEFLEVSFLFVF